MMRLIAVAMIFVLALAPGAHAQSSQDVVWVQIEAQPSLAAATERARDYAVELQDVNGFELGGGWYGIALGPYAPEDAAQVLRVYRSERLIPSDSYIALSSAYDAQFWPIGANVLNRGVVRAPVALDQPETGTDAETAQATPDVPLEPVDETPAEARRSERNLTPEERKALQIALQWAGFYNASIDGSFGRGTRSAMAAWQVAKNFEATGILTTVQRAALLRDYNAVFDGLGLKRITETTSGIEMLLPMQVVGFSRYEPPFVHFDATGDLEAKVLLISQAGDRDTLFGLYDIMQTLEIVPLTGPRDRNSSGFTLIGQNARMISETRVTLRDGQIKGFTLIWPTGDEARRTRIIEEMDKSFVRLGGVLDPAAGAPDAQSIDLISGLKIRKPRLSRSGFFVNANGAVVTTSEAVQSCTRITLDQDFEATVAAEDSDRGIAILKPDDALAPTRIAEFSATAPRLQSDVAVAGYSFEDVLNAPTMTFGTLADLRGLGGEEDLKRLDLAPLPGDAGGPVFDANGNVLGMLLPRSRGAQQLPEAVSFALTGGAIATVMERAGLSVTSGTRTVPLDAEDITARGVGMTVLVSCWD